MKVFFSLCLREHSTIYGRMPSHERSCADVLQEVEDSIGNKFPLVAIPELTFCAETHLVPNIISFGVLKTLMVAETN